MFPARAGMNRMLVNILKLKRVFPARAGMNRLSCSRLSAAVSVPRTRGDEPASGVPINAELACSPHARG